MQIYFAIPPNSALHGLLEEFFFLYQRYKISNTLAINLLGNAQHFRTVPNYIANVAKGESYEDEDYTVFNVTLPYPYFFYSEDRWYCSCIRDFQMSLTGDNKFFELGGLNCPAYPNYLQSNDLFLAGIANVGVVVEAFEDESFDVRLHCVLPYDNPYNNEQSLNYGYCEV